MGAFKKDTSHFIYSATLLLAIFLLSDARHTIFISQNGAHSYTSTSDEPTVCMEPKCIIAASELLTSMDETVDPCDDFYTFACGGWIKRSEISEDKDEISITDGMQTELNRKLRELLESKYENSDPPFAKMLKDVYNTCVDIDSIEKKGSEPLTKILSRLGGLPVLEGDKWDGSTFDWLDTLISFRKLGFDHNCLMILQIIPEVINETVPIFSGEAPQYILPPESNITLGLNDEKIEAYFRDMLKAAKLLGVDEISSEKELLDVVNFTIALQNISIIQSEKNKDIFSKYSTGERTIRFITVKELQEDVPHIPWMKYFNGMFNDAVYENDILYAETSIFYLNELAHLLASTEKRVIANYMLMLAVIESAQSLSEEWKTIGEKPKKLESPRWKMCLSYLMKEMEIGVSSYYVRHYLKEESKDEAMTLMKYIHREFLKILKENDWMDEKTRKIAEEKANAIKSYIGYPKELLNDTFMMKTYENLITTTDSYLENVLAFRKMRVDNMFSTLRNPIEETKDSRFKYIMNVGAYYDPRENSMAIPAGILHDAYFDSDRPNYMNFGAIGYVIGHEITHGFDNQGRYFDKDGSRANWWDEKSDENFIKKVQCIIDQYDNYTTDVGMKVNGKLTQNENIADNGGLKEAYLAYQSWTKDHGAEPVLPALNYTQNQLFWLSAAHVWCLKIEPEWLKKKLLMDPHSPGRYRVIGPMSNLEEFSRDFKCSADSPMNRKYKCKVW